MIIFNLKVKMVHNGNMLEMNFEETEKSEKLNTAEGFLDQTEQKIADKGEKTLPKAPNILQKDFLNLKFASVKKYYGLCRENYLQEKLDDVNNLKVALRQLGKAMKECGDFDEEIAVLNAFEFSPEKAQDIKWETRQRVADALRSRRDEEVLAKRSSFLDWVRGERKAQSSRIKKVA